MMHLKYATLLVPLLIVGCDQRRHYVVENRTVSRVEDVRVMIGEHHDFPHGVLIPRSHSSYSGPIAGSGQAAVEISWIPVSAPRMTNRFTVHHNQLRIEDNVYFVFTPTGVVAQLRNSK
jgi:hypothetical protein